MNAVNSLSKQLKCMCTAVLLFALLNYSANADIRIAVLDFELKDVTLNPRTAGELERTASVKPLLQSFLEKDGNYVMVQIDGDTQREANAGFGYLFDHHDLAADLGEKVGVQYIVVGRVHKPSFLFAYLMVHLVDVKTKRLVGNYIVEVKGPQEKITVKGVEALAKKIQKAINH